MSSARDVPAFAEAKAAASASDQELAELWRRVGQLHSKRLWHQLTQVLVKMVASSGMAGKPKLLKELYDNVIVDFENKLNPLSLVELCIPITHAMEDKEDSLKFIKAVGDKVKQSAEAYALTVVVQGNVCLNSHQDLQKTKAIVEEVDKLLNEVENVGTVHKAFYLLCSDYYKVLGLHAEYYQASLRYLGCSELSERSDDQNKSLALHLCLAALLGKDIFNFGELLAHPVLQFLDNCPETWLVELLRAFNRGDVDHFRKFKPKWGQQADLLKCEELLYEKICLLALMEMTFQRPPTERQLKYSEVSEKTGLPTNKIELLVMKALSRNLVKGKIDQVSETIQLTWVQPRVLDRIQLATLKTKMEIWCKSISAMEDIIQADAAEILTV